MDGDSDPDRADFDALVEPVYRFLNETPDRSPMTDWYQTKTARRVGFTARPVVGGVFAQMLYDRAAWSKWASQDKTKAGNWAALPTPPKTVIAVPTSEEEPIVWRYTTMRPAGKWFAPEFDASNGTKVQADSEPPAHRVRSFGRSGSRQTSGCGVSLRCPRPSLRAWHCAFITMKT